MFSCGVYLEIDFFQKLPILAQDFQLSLSQYF